MAGMEAPVFSLNFVPEYEEAILDPAWFAGVGAWVERCWVIWVAREEAILVERESMIRNERRVMFGWKEV
jgi:hypothetical protein